MKEVSDKNLIFLVSQPRSGSTLLQNILSNNGCVNTCSEPWLLLPFLSLNKKNLIKAEYNEKIATVAFKDYLKKFQLDDQYFLGLQKLLLNLYQPQFKDSFYYILDKTPRYYEILDELINIFPNAKIIILKRDPLDVLNSIIHTWEVDSMYKLYQYKRDILNAPFILHDFLQKNAHQNNVYEISYEKLIANTRFEISKLYDWLEIKFSVDVLNFSSNSKTQGRFGDKVGVKKYKEVKKESRFNDKENLKYDPFWKEFFLGYANYLGKDFLKNYGDYHHDGKNTKVFSDYKFCSDLKYYDNDLLTFRNISKLLRYKLESLFRSKYTY